MKTYTTVQGDMWDMIAYKTLGSINLREFGAWLESEGLQAIATRVSTGGECSIIIERGHREFQFSDDGVLLFNRYTVALYKGIAEIGDVLVFDPFTVQGVEPDPGPSLGGIVPQNPANVAAAAAQLLNKLAGRAVIATFGGDVLAVLIVALCDVAYIIVCVEQDLQVGNQLFDRVPDLSAYAAGRYGQL